MKATSSHLAVFALSAAAVTSAFAGAREDCIQNLVPAWKDATLIAEKRSLGGTLVVAYHLPAVGNYRATVAIINSRNTAVSYFPGLSPDKVKFDDVGLIRERPDSVVSINGTHDDAWKSEYLKCFSMK